MSARRLSLFLPGLAIVLLAAMLVIAAIAWQTAGAYADRTEAALDRAGAIVDVRSATNAYGRDVIAVLMLGRALADQLGTSRIDVERSLAYLTQATKAEFATLGGIAQVQDQLPEVDAARRITELYHAIDAATNTALSQQRAGNSSDALQLYNSTISFRLNNELSPLLDDEAGKEQAEVEALRAASASAQLNLLIVTGVVAALGIIALIALAVLLRQRLAAGAAAQATRWRDINARLQTVDEQRAHFLADISHQLRTPLTILRGEADVALRGEPPAAELRASMQRVQAQAAEMATLLEDVMAYARSDAESRTHEPVDVRLDDIVGAALVEGQTLAEPREITIAAAFKDFGSRLNADPRRLRHALLIGLDNAIKHTAPGGRIEVETALAGDGVVVHIRDNGPGIDPAEQPHLFDRFFRGRGEADLLNDGNGVGLAIARDIVGRHGGSIDLANREEGGAVLQIALPLGGAAR